MDGFELTKCERCGQQPGFGEPRLCCLCVARGIAEAHPVPLPKGEGALRDLAQMGYEPAVYRLAELGIKQ